VHQVQALLAGVRLASFFQKKPEQKGVALRMLGQLPN
jgi:hypothetical protein